MYVNQPDREMIAGQNRPHNFKFNLKQVGNARTASLRDMGASMCNPFD